MYGHRKNIRPAIVNSKLMVPFGPGNSALDKKVGLTNQQVANAIEHSLTEAALMTLRQQNNQHCLLLLPTALREFGGDPCKTGKN